MEYTGRLKEYGVVSTQQQVSDLVKEVKSISAKNCNPDVYKICYSCIDLTSLNVSDSVESITEFTTKVVQFPINFPAIPNVASICVYPLFVDAVGLVVGESSISITSVSGGFPSSQTYVEVKMLETAMAVENGADEIDIVINVGQLLGGDYEQLANEIETIGVEVGAEVILKVIIECGVLKTPELIRNASLLAMLAGADFIKTSTGKVDSAATPEAAIIMCQAIKEYFEKTGRMVGFKVAGGVKTAQDAALYYTIVESILGEEWLSSDLFRIGTSSAANNILSAIESKDIAYF